MTTIKSTTSESKALKLGFKFIRDDGKRGTKTLELGESATLIENYAKRYFLEHCTDVTNIEFSAPLFSVRVGDIIAVNMPAFGVFGESGGAMNFIVESVNVSVSHLDARVSVRAKRYDY